jgi:hypothetical protein
MAAVVDNKKSVSALVISHELQCFAHHFHVGRFGWNQPCLGIEFVSSEDFGKIIEFPLNLQLVFLPSE